LFTYRAYFYRLDVSLNKEALYDRERDFKKAEMAFRNHSPCRRSDLSMMLNYFKERNIELENVDHKVIRDYLLTLHKRKLKKTSIYKKVSCIKSFFKFCKERSWFRKDPAKIIEFPKFDMPVPSFLTEKEMESCLCLYWN